MVTDFCQQHIIDGDDVDTNQWKTGLTPSVDLCTYETSLKNKTPSVNSKNEYIRTLKNIEILRLTQHITLYDRLFHKT